MNRIVSIKKIMKLSYLSQDFNIVHFVISILHKYQIVDLRVKLKLILQLLGD